MMYNKYSNKKTVVDNIRFDSKKEAARYCELKLLKKGKIIKDLILQPRFELQEKFNGERAIVYVADFMYYDNEKQTTIVEDVKGIKTEIYKIKRKMFLFKYPQYQFVEI